VFGVGVVGIWRATDAVAMTEADLELLAEVDLAAGWLVDALDGLEGEDVVAAGVSIVKERLHLDGWPDDEPESAEESGEPSDRPPAVYYAPRGECAYCDRRRAAAARSMARTREREG